MPLADLLDVLTIAPWNGDPINNSHPGGPFLALDRPLDDRQQAEVRSLSTRATITATSFINDYHWGNFRGDPNRMMERYYDAHLYLTNWGTHRIMLRLPRDLLDIDVAEDHCVGDK
ncbi:MAG TPA: hypothetical protein VHY21_17405 [Pseudonocardiaceae bacterium]|nr:hypothetical protein [Pseudonocardiaceae bacterium]